MGNFNRECKISFKYNFFNLFIKFCVVVVQKENDDLIYWYCFFELLRDYLKVNVLFIFILVDEIFIIRKEEIIMYCLYGNYLIMGCNYCKMKVFCGCYISNGDYLILIDLYVCKGKMYKVDYMYIKNIIIFKEFFQVIKNDLINLIYDLKKIKMY